METEKTLTPEQIRNWRKIIALQLYEKAKSMGLKNPEDYTLWAHVMPEAEVISYWKKLKQLFEAPQVPTDEELFETEREFKPKRIIERKPCQHKNCIKGSKGRYCLDCDCYV